LGKFLIKLATTNKFRETTRDHDFGTGDCVLGTSHDMTGKVIMGKDLHKYVKTYRMPWTVYYLTLHISYLKVGIMIATISY
jgi:hypothetical protein